MQRLRININDIGFYYREEDESIWLSIQLSGDMEDIIEGRISREELREFIIEGIDVLQGASEEE